MELIVKYIMNDKKENCNICEGKPRKYSWDEVKICSECLKIQIALNADDDYEEKKILEDIIYKDYEMQITYDLTRKEHDGYCSDHGEITERNYKNTVIYPLLKAFKNSDIDKRGNVSLLNQKLIYYNTFRVESYHCCGTSGRIVEACVIEKKEIKLDD